MNSVEKEYHYSDAKRTFAHHYLRERLDSLIEKCSADLGTRLKILEIGSGNGEFTNYLVRKGFDVVGMEPSVEGNSIAQSGFPQCRFINQSIYDPVLSDLRNSFDLILAVEVIEHLPYPRKFLVQAKEYLKKPGRMILTTPYHGYLKNLALSLSGGWDRHFSVEWEGGHVKFYSPRSLERLLSGGGLTGTKFYFAGRVPFLWKSMISLSCY